MSPARRGRPGTGSGEMFPGYRDATEIGRGAASTVYRAVEVATDRPVALKVLTVGGSRHHDVDAFDAEGRALAAVSGHPNIVTLYGAGTTPGGRPMLVLELCRGSYADRLRAEGPLHAGPAVAVGIKIAGALETAHRADVLHLDVKPHNLLVTPYGEPALADFGVAGVPAATDQGDGVVGFTTEHASPEVLEGGPVSPATDVYGLASTIYQLLTGRAPFAAFDGEAPASVILRILRDPVMPVRLPGVPIALSDLLGRAMAKDPAGRPRRAVDLADALCNIETAAGWAPTTPVVWGDAPGRPAEAGPVARPLGAPAPPAGAPPPPVAPPPTPPQPTTVRPTPPPRAPAAPGQPSSAHMAPGEIEGGERGPSVVRPQTSPRMVVAPDPPGGGTGSTTPAGSGALAPLRPVRPDGGPRLLQPPPPPPGPAPEDLRPTAHPAPAPVSPPAPPPVADAGPTWALPTGGVDGPLSRTGIPELRPAPGGDRTLGPAPQPAARRTAFVVAASAGSAVVVALLVLLLLGRL